MNHTSTTPASAVSRRSTAPRVSAPAAKRAPQAAASRVSASAAAQHPRAPSGGQRRGSAPKRLSRALPSCGISRSTAALGGSALARRSAPTLAEHAARATL